MNCYRRLCTIKNRLLLEESHGLHTTLSDKQ